MRDVFWVSFSLVLCGAIAWLVVRRYPDALDRIPDEETDDLGARPTHCPPAQRKDAA